MCASRVAAGGGGGVSLLSSAGPSLAAGWGAAALAPAFSPPRHHGGGRPPCTQAWLELAVDGAQHARHALVCHLARPRSGCAGGWAGGRAPCPCWRPRHHAANLSKLTCPIGGRGREDGVRGQAPGLHIAPTSPPCSCARVSAPRRRQGQGVRRWWVPAQAPGASGRPPGATPQWAQFGCAASGNIVTGSTVLQRAFHDGDVVRCRVCGAPGRHGACRA